MPIRLTPFDRPEETLNWAAEAIDELHALCDDFLTNGMSIVVEPHDKPKYQCLKVKALQPMPSAIRRRATEALNNIRHSFDQSLHAACVVLRQPRPKTNFPWRQTPGEVKGYLRSKEIPADLWEVIEGEEPYPRGQAYSGGDDFLHAMAQIANGKHTVGIRVFPRIREAPSAPD